MDDPNVSMIVELLQQYEPGFLPYPLFEQIARLVALPIVEFVPLRRNQVGKTEVLLIARPDDDPLWPGLLHTPGTVIRATDINPGNDNEPWAPFARILHDELDGVSVGLPQYVGSTLHASKRGAEQAQLYWVLVEGHPSIGTFYVVDALPEHLMESQLTFISEAVRHFEQQN